MRNGKREAQMRTNGKREAQMRANEKWETRSTMRTNGKREAQMRANEKWETRSTNEDERETRGTNEGECRNEKRETRMYFWATVERQFKYYKFTCLVAFIRFQTFHSDRFWSCVHTVVHCMYIHTVIIKR